MDKKKCKDCDLFKKEHDPNYPLRAGKCTRSGRGIFNGRNLNDTCDREETLKNQSK